MHGARTSEVLDKSVTHVVAYHREGQEIPGNHILWRYVTEIEYVTTEIACLGQLCRKTDDLLFYVTVSEEELSRT